MNMRYVSIEQVKQGEKLGKHIFASDGRILLSEGVPLTIGLISKLRRMGVSSLFVKDARFEDVEIEEVVSETTKRKAVTALAQSIQYIQEDKKLDGKSVSESVSSLVEEIMLNKDVLFHLTDIRTEDNDLFMHSVNVCIMSVMVAVQIGLTKDKVQELAVGALLHDIGKHVSKVRVNDIPAGFENNDELLNHHAWKGFNLLRKTPEISTLSAHIALSHHENIDGTGAPRQMDGKDIHLLAKIVAIANDYDHFVSGMSDEAMYPFEACEKIMGLTNKRYEHQVVWRFLRCVAFYPTGSQVKLSNGHVGAVVGQHKGLPQRPIIRTFDPDGDDITFEEIDLAKETTVFINKVFS
ncbi:HD domain-containing protein [Bacillus shivajii]|uniref:HD-GYP domain-containing protein n=1 Tax=Bacillus shivajii TaxID=1983719 RepID=UPI001CFAF0F1|nr:HD domain-containing phosphohydrolase [Bacillus shivajii]UCZ51900.1 HD domain-containing protein [Bacillus shivajii]